jgi:hypothetical protein
MWDWQSPMSQNHKPKPIHQTMTPNQNIPGGFIPKHGGYRNLITYQKSEIIYDGTVYFTQRFFRKYDGTIALLQGKRMQAWLKFYEICSDQKAIS